MVQPAPTTLWCPSHWLKSFSPFKGSVVSLRNVTSIHGGVYRCKADNNVRPPAVMDITLQIRTKPVARAFRKSYGQARDKNLEVEIACIISGKHDVEERKRPTIVGTSISG